MAGERSVWAVGPQESLVGASGVRAAEPTGIRKVAGSVTAALEFRGRAAPTAVALPTGLGVERGVRLESAEELVD